MMRRIDRNRETPQSAAGLTLVEMLVVLGIIGIISAVIVPVAIRSGWFTASKSSFAARELFTLLKAANVYAGTYNVETALAYGGRLVRDSESDQLVPVADTVVLARRLKREEIIVLIEGGHSLSADGTYFAPVLGPEGVFRPLPNQTCVLPDLFSVDSNGNSNKGLVGVQLYDIDARRLYEPRGGLDYVIDNLPFSFPAHIFNPDGSMDDNSKRTRFIIRTGVLPDQAHSDRFHTSEEFPLDVRPISVVFDRYDTDGTTPITVDTYYSTDPNDDPNTPADIDGVLELFVPTGRVRIVS